MKHTATMDKNAGQAPTQELGQAVSHALTAQNRGLQQGSTLNRQIEDVSTSMIRDMADRQRLAREAFRVSAFSGAYTGVLFAASQMGVPKFQRDSGEVIFQNTETFMAAWESRTPKRMQESVEKMLNEQNPKGLEIAVMMPLVEGFHQANATPRPGQRPLIDPQIIRNHASTGEVRNLEAMNRRAPHGEDRPVFYPIQIEMGQGFVPVYGYDRGRGDAREVLIVDPLDEERIRLVSKVDFQVQLTEKGPKILRTVPDGGIAGVYPVVTEEDRRTLDAAMTAQGWERITQRPHIHADIPPTFRGIGAQVLSARAILTTAQAVEKGAMKAGLEAFTEGNDGPIRDLPGAPERAIAEQYRRMAVAMSHHDLTDRGIEILFDRLEQPMKALAALDRKIQEVVKDPVRFADPEISIRLALEGRGPAAVKDQHGNPINWIEGLNDQQKKQLRRSINSMEDTAKRDMEALNRSEVNSRRGRSRHVSIPEVDRLYALNYLVKDLSERLDLYVKDEKGQRIPVMEEGQAQQAKWPDGSPRFQTHLDGELARAQDLYGELNGLIANLQHSTLSAAQSIDQLRVILANSDNPEDAAQAMEVAQLLEAYHATKLKIAEHPLPSDQMELVEKALQRGDEGLAYLDELRSAHAMGALAAADTLKLTHIRRDIVTFAYDQHPMDTNLNPFDQKAYAAPPAPEMSQKNGTFWCVPENDTRETWTIYSVGQEMGSGTNTVVEHAYGLSYEQMVAERRRLNFENAYIMTVNQPLKQAVNIQTAIAQKFRLPILENFPDPTRGGEPHTAIFLGATVHSGGVGTGLLPGNARPIVFDAEATPIVDKAFTRIHQDEQSFVRFNDINYVKRLLYNSGLAMNRTQIGTAVDDLFRRKGRYEYPDREDAFRGDAYQKQRERTVQLMSQFELMKVQNRLQREQGSGQASPDRKAEMDNLLQEAKDRIGMLRANAAYDAKLFAEGFQAFAREKGARPNKGDAWIGLATDLSGSKRPPFVFRFENTNELVQKLPKLARYGVSLHPHVVFAD